MDAKFNREVSHSAQILANQQRLAHVGGWELDTLRLDDILANPLRWTDETYRIFGYEPGSVEVTLDLFLQAMHSEDRPRVRAAVMETVAGQTHYELENRILLPDGRERHIHQWAEILNDETGRPLCLVGTCQDVTDRKRAEDALREREDQLRLIMDAVPACISYVDPEYRYELANHTYQRWFGHDPNTLRGRSVREVVGEAAWVVVLPYLERAMQGESLTFACEMPYPGGARWTNLSYTPDRDSSGRVRGVVVLASDIGEQKAAEAVLRSAAVQSEAANRAKDEFLAMLGHELRNPLAPIVTAVQLMKLRGNRPGPNEIAIIERQSQHLLRLVDDLLDVARIERGKIELCCRPINLSMIVGQAVEEASPLVELHQHALRLEVDPSLLVSADETRLVQVFTNLLTNAAKYTPRGGRIVLTARRESEELVVRVTDNGIGISPELLPHIFNLFVQGPRELDRQQGGLGLGLSLVRSIVTLHGGRITARSGGLGCGSEFEVRLLALAPARAAPAAEPKPTRAEASERPAVRVMVVDDNEDAADLVAELLAHSGYLVAIAHDGVQALELASRFAPEIAILDIGLPIMDGYELAKRLHEHPHEHPNGRMPILIALTGYGQARDRQRSDRAGFRFHLVKPVSGEDLLHAVAAAAIS